MTSADANLGALFDEVFDGGDGSANTSIISYGKSGFVKRNIEVTAHQHSLALELFVLQIRDGALKLRLLDNY